jgi:hypothetical protein
VNARLPYISVDGLHYSFEFLRYDGLVDFIKLLTFNILAPLHFLIDKEILLATETEQDQKRLPLLQY